MGDEQFSIEEPHGIFLVEQALLEAKKCLFGQRISGGHLRIDGWWIHAVVRKVESN
jgi:hypothetical protein